MEPPKHRHSWWITVRTRFNGLEFRLATSGLLPNRGAGGESICFSLRLRRLFLLEFESENRAAANPAPPAAANAAKRSFWKKIFRRRRWFSRPKIALWKKKKKSAEVSKAVNPFNTGTHHHQSRTMSEGFYAPKLHRLIADGLVAAMFGIFTVLAYFSFEKDREGMAIQALSSVCYLVSYLRMRSSSVYLRVFGVAVAVAGCFRVIWLVRIIFHWLL